MRGHSVRRQHKIDQTRRDGAGRHAVKLGRFGELRHDHAAFSLDGAQAVRTIAPRSGKHYPDGSGTHVEGQGLEKKVDGQAMAARRQGLEQLQSAVHQPHVVPWRNDVHATGLDDHAVFDFVNLHARVAADKLSQDALAVRRQMLNEHKGHVGVGTGRHAGIKSL